MKIGDKVRFLNTVGGGIVSRFINKDTVSVLEDDGFETPVLVRECVVIENVNEKNNLPQPQAAKKETTSIAASTPTVETNKEELFEETPEGEKLTVALAFVPQYTKKMQTTAFDWYLVNDSNYTLYYNVSAVQHNSAKVLKNGIVNLNTVLFLQEIAKEQLNDFEKINVQFIAFKTDKSYGIKPSISFTLKIKLVNFYKLHSFVENDYFDEAAMVLPIITQDRLEIPLDMEKLMLTEKEEIPIQKQATKKEQKSVVEVDLHIHQLLDNTANLSAADMLSYQLKKVDETLNEYKTQKGQKIIFIHGKGNGVLRNEIINEIRKKYSSYTYQDASFREYGFGATLITVK